jgi:hypothetical protein
LSTSSPIRSLVTRWSRGRGPALSDRLRRMPEIGGTGWWRWQSVANPSPDPLSCREQTGIARQNVHQPVAPRGGLTRRRWSARFPIACLNADQDEVVEVWPTRSTAIGVVSGGCLSSLLTRGHVPEVADMLRAGKIHPKHEPKNCLQNAPSGLCLALFALAQPRGFPDATADEITARDRDTGRMCGRVNRRVCYRPANARDRSN